MKKLFIGLIAALALSVNAATLAPVGLLNPAGSSSGQAILSTGPTTPPVWGNPSASGTVAIANGGTGATSAAQALTNLGAAPLASPTFTGTPAAPTAGVVANSTTLATTAWVRLLLASPAAIGNTAANTGQFTTLSATGLITPASTIGIKGTATNDSAQAGSVGEYGEATGTTISLTSGTAVNITSVSLAPGDYDISGVIEFNPAGTTVFASMFSSISTTSGALGGLGQRSSIQVSHSAGVGDQLPTPVWRGSFSATTTVYLVANQFFTTSTATATGKIRWRRIR